jgi:hypothetical protein
VHDAAPLPLEDKHREGDEEREPLPLAVKLAVLVTDRLPLAEEERHRDGDGDTVPLTEPPASDAVPVTESVGVVMVVREAERQRVAEPQADAVVLAEAQDDCEALRLCGAVNVLGDLPGAAPRVAPEAVVRARPQLILATRADASPERWRMAGLTGPGRESAFIAFDGRELERASPRMLDPLAQLCEMIDAQRARITSPGS